MGWFGNQSITTLVCNSFQRGLPVCPEEVVVIEPLFGKCSRLCISVNVI